MTCLPEWLAPSHLLAEPWREECLHWWGCPCRGARIVEAVRVSGCRAVFQLGVGEPCSKWGTHSAALQSFSWREGERGDKSVPTYLAQDLKHQGAPYLMTGAPLHSQTKSLDYFIL